MITEPRTVKIRYDVFSKCGIKSKYAKKKSIYGITTQYITRGIPNLVELERELNNGLLASEAEAAYPRAGFHNKEIFKVHISGRNTKWIML